MMLRELRRPGGLAAAAQKLCRERGREKQSLVIDYSSPNVAKQFHIGNLRSTLLGRFIDQIHRFVGDDVVSLNYLGDWGTQFAMIAAYWPQSRPSESYWNSLTPDEKIRSLTECYVVANKMNRVDEEFKENVRKTFRKMEDDLINGNLDTEELQLWTEVKTLSQDHLVQFYKMLNIQFDKFICESDQVRGARAIVEQLMKEGLVKETEHKTWIVDSNGDVSSNSDYAVLRKSDETTLYLSRDLASILEREKLWNADKYVYVVDKSQTQHFQYLKMVLRRMGKLDLSEKIYHIPYGRVLGLSTRMGKTESVTAIMDSGVDLARKFILRSPTSKVNGSEQIEQLANQLSLDTIVVNELKRSRKSEYEFSFKNAFDLNQNNALLLHEKHSRLCSIEENNSGLLEALHTCDTLPPDGAALIKHLHEAPLAILNSAVSNEPCQFTIYLIHLAQLASRTASRLKVKDESVDVALPRLLLLSTARSVLGQGMQLIGLKAAEKIWECNRFNRSSVRISHLEGRQWYLPGESLEKQTSTRSRMSALRESMYWKWRRMLGRSLTPKSHFQQKNSISEDN